MQNPRTVPLLLTALLLLTTAGALLTTPVAIHPDTAPTTDPTDTPTTLHDTSAPLATSGRVDPTPMVVALNQSTAIADRITIASITANATSWIVIHEDNTGSPGLIIGHRAVAAGTTTNVTVDLNRSAVHGETLHAMLHDDDGAIGTYEFPANDGPSTHHGSVVNTPFTVWQTARVTTAASHQLVDLNQTLHIAEAALNGTGFLVISATTGEDTSDPDNLTGANDTASALAVIPVSTGLTTNLTATPSRDLIPGETLLARLHYDAGPAGTFDPNDPPVEVGDTNAHTLFTVGYQLAASAPPISEITDPDQRNLTWATIQTNETIRVSLRVIVGGNSFAISSENPQLAPGVHHNVTLTLQGFATVQVAAYQLVTVTGSGAIQNDQFSPRFNVTLPPRIVLDPTEQITLSEGDTSIGFASWIVPHDVHIVVSAPSGLQLASVFHPRNNTTAAEFMVNLSDWPSPTNLSIAIYVDNGNGVFDGAVDDPLLMIGATAAVYSLQVSHTQYVDPDSNPDGTGDDTGDGTNGTQNGTGEPEPGDLTADGDVPGFASALAIMAMLTATIILARRNRLE